jgi:hypothetical protein
MKDTINTPLSHSTFDTSTADEKPDSTKFSIYTDSFILPDSSFIGKWSGSYIDLNECKIEIILDIEHCDTSTCIGKIDFWNKSILMLHGQARDTFPFLADKVYNSLNGKFGNHAYTFNFFLECFRIENRRKNPPRLVLEGSFREAIYNEYTRGPVVLWKRR